MPRINNFYKLRESNQNIHKANASLCNKVHNAETIPTIYLYDFIDSDPYYGFTAKQMAELLSGIESDEINLRINSGGGDVFEARAIYSLLAQHPAKINVFIDGLAASAATYIALAGDTRQMIEGAFFMIHNAWTVVYGNKNELRTVADDLDKIDSSIRKDYMRVSSASEENLSDWMDAETWLDAEECLEHGFIDSIVTVGESDQSVSNAWDLSAYSNAPKIEAPKNKDITPPIEPDEPEKLGAPDHYGLKAKLITLNI